MKEVSHLGNKRKKICENDIITVSIIAGGFIRPDIWSKFINNENNHNVDVHIFIHNKNTKNNNIPVVNNECIHIIPTVHTWRNTISLVRATIQLLRYATKYYDNENYEQDNNNNNNKGQENNEEQQQQFQFDHYILVSGDSVPLVNASTLIKDLELSSNNKESLLNNGSSSSSSTSTSSSSSSSSSSRFEQHSQNQYHTPYIFRYGINVNESHIGYGSDSSRSDGMRTNKDHQDTNYGYEKILKSKQWFTMNHNDALWFANEKNDKTFNYEMMVTSDEYHFATLSNEYQNQHDDNNNDNDNDSQNSTTTLVVGQYPGLFVRDGPFMYDVWPINIQTDHPSYLDLVNDTIYNTSGHLFARKITKQTNISLSWLEEEESSLLLSLSDNKRKVVDDLIPGQVVSLTPNLYEQLLLKSKQQYQESNSIVHQQFFVQVNSQVCGIQRRQQQEQEQEQNNSNNICDNIYSNIWKLFAEKYPNQLFALLDCDDTYEQYNTIELCRTIYSNDFNNDRLTMLEERLHVDFVTVTHHNHGTQHQYDNNDSSNNTSNDGNRLIEFYNDKLNAQSLVQYYQDKINSIGNGNGNGSGYNNNSNNDNQDNIFLQIDEIQFFRLPFNRIPKFRRYLQVSMMGNDVVVAESAFVAALVALSVAAVVVF
ncbi:hypothetical protein FRACYDRAFT_238450 [Fragilariopsis cylindrus CCMP1102]|uniref:Uncharacterized protein n=1 Tax=Fragilariopsis cylindrus CCMP1102 TaxID=635003 RepID=A0A1E7FIN6_9STRA|nr:hypothetical protein FRACYDRAFT_238450 [Fragilariopsis cylindrus CCMP1102]|eukprot:OEU18018.1 hypothetical protein FRACYDRAFT_238450 [Fragilariopsis cylindrus CCMP1102]